MKPILPGATIGIIGGGQLARMMAIEAKSMGYRVAVLDPDDQGPAAQLADSVLEGAFRDAEAARQLAEISDVVTIDTEHVPASILEDLESTTSVRPSSNVLRIIQDRLEQRRFLEQQGLPQPPYAEVSTAADIGPAAKAVGFPAVLKTRREGYDGKGQVRVHSVEDLQTGWAQLGETPSTLEAFIDFEMEVSTVLARGLDGEARFYPIAENEHRNHILHITRAPARIPPELHVQAERIGDQVAKALDHIGMLAVELFVTREQTLLINEIAPRTHNSGHFTFGACATSQFEQHIRAICGLPLGDPSLLRPAAMLNLLGDSWLDGEPDYGAVMGYPGAHLHLYGKREPRPGRKMGHVLVLDETLEEAGRIASRIDREIGRKRGQ